MDDSHGLKTSDRTIKQLDTAREKFAALFNISPVIMGLVDIETSTIIDVNQTFYDALGFKPEEVIGKKPPDVLKLDPEYRKIAIERLKARGRIKNEETIIYRKDGTVLHVLFSAEMFQFQQKRYYLATVIDITSQKQVENKHRFQTRVAVALSKAGTLDQVLSTVLDGLFQLDEPDSGGIYLVNDAGNAIDFKTYRGLSEEFVDRVRHYDHTDIQFQLIMKGDAVYLPAEEYPDSIRDDLHVSGIQCLGVAPIKSGGKVVGCINLASHSRPVFSDYTRDLINSITENEIGMAISRVMAEEKLRENEEKYREIFEGLSDVFIKTNYSGVIQIVSPSAFSILGYRAEELIGRHIEILFADPSDNQVFLALIGKKKSVRAYEFEFKRKDGQVFNASANVDLKLDRNGNPVSLSGTLRDITDWKKAETEKIKAQKITGENEKMALVGQIAGKMAHDFNNILGIIMGNAQLSLIGLEDEKLRKTIQIIFDQTIRGKNLTKNLVAFAKDQELKQEFFTISEKIDLVITLLKRDLEGIRLIQDEYPGLTQILADPGMIEHTLVNLMQNAIHALSLTSEPQITLRTYAKSGHVCFEIEDNGCGIPKDHLASIFDPSFTLKGRSDQTGSYKTGIKGTGYGMANVKKYIEQHMGYIHIESTVEKGTRVVIGLPIIEKKLSEKEKFSLESKEKFFKKYILLVEDEIGLSDLQYQILTQGPCRHKVDIAPNGQVAMDLFDRNTYDFVSLDYILPGQINGMDVYHHIRKKNNTIPILFISGNIEFLESIKDLKRKDAFIGHISKPCQNIDYVNSIENLLEKTLSDD